MPSTSAQIDFRASRPQKAKAILKQDKMRQKVLFWLMFCPARSEKYVFCRADSRTQRLAWPNIAAFVFLIQVKRQTFTRAHAAHPWRCQQATRGLG